FHSVAYSVAQITNAVSQFTGYSSVVFRVFFILLLHRVVPVLIRLVFRCVISVPGSLIFCCIISVFSHIILRRVVFHLFFFLFFSGIFFFFFVLGGVLCGCSGFVRIIIGVLAAGCQHA